MLLLFFKMMKKVRSSDSGRMDIYVNVRRWLAMVSLFARVPPRLILPVARFRLYSPLPPSNQSHHHYDYHHHFNDEYDPRKMEKEDVSSTLAVLLGASSPMRFLHPIPHVLIRRELNAFCHAHFLTRIFSISRSS